MHERCTILKDTEVRTSGGTSPVRWLSQEVAILRNQVHQRYGGRCAYCGVEITLKEMHVDHIEPLRRGLMRLPEEIERLSQIDNLNPACASCNHRKRTHPLEEFRAEIAAQVHRLRRDSNQFKLAERFGLVEATEKPVIFWFER